MLYIQQSLGPDEELIAVGNFHWMYTVKAMLSIFWGILGSVIVIAGSVFMYQRLGTYPEDLEWLWAVRNLHAGLRAASFIVFLLGLLNFAQMMVTRATTEIAITNKRLVYKRGLVARYVGEMSIDRIEGVNVLQSFFGRIFDYGRLMVRGMGVGEVILPIIQNPVGFRKAIEEAKAHDDKERI